MYSESTALPSHDLSEANSAVAQSPHLIAPSCSDSPGPNQIHENISASTDCDTEQNYRMGSSIDVQAQSSRRSQFQTKLQRSEQPSETEGYIRLEINGRVAFVKDNNAVVVEISRHDTVLKISDMGENSTWCGRCQGKGIAMNTNRQLRSNCRGTGVLEHADIPRDRQGRPLPRLRQNVVIRKSDMSPRPQGQGSHLRRALAAGADRPPTASTPHSPRAPTDRGNAVQALSGDEELLKQGARRRSRQQPSDSQVLQANNDTQTPEVDVELSNLRLASSLQGVDDDYAQRFASDTRPGRPARLSRAEMNAASQTV
jgi:hypothetical protein